jgi:hypothetical protein
MRQFQFPKESAVGPFEVLAGSQWFRLNLEPIYGPSPRNLGAAGCHRLFKRSKTFKPFSIAGKDQIGMATASLFTWLPTNVPCIFPLEQKEIETLIDPRRIANS